jgi:hypothetical protein
VIFLVFVLNFVISWFNAVSVGKVWDASKAKGGVAHFMTWMGAVMSASGFTWCYLLVLGLIASVTPMQVFADEGEVLTGMILDPASLQVFFELGYMVIILPILGSGLAITVQSWRQLAMRRAQGEANFGDYAVTGWNTFAQAHNMYSFAREAPGIMSHLGSFFGGDSEDSGKAKFIIILVMLAVGGGILTTFGIVQKTRRDQRYTEAYLADQQQEQTRLV